MVNSTDDLTLDGGESVVEALKRGSDHLRGDLANDLANDLAKVSPESEQLLKFHGIYAQDDRDVRRERTQSGQEPAFIFMVRVVVPGGRLSASQWLTLDEISSSVADGSIRLTTRQAVQFHGVAKGDLRELASSLDRHYLSSFGACGDVVRNVVTCASLSLDHVAGDAGSPADDLTTSLRESFKSTSTAHWEIFVNGEAAATREADERPFYGETYLPRKFKIAVAHADENCVDVFANDVGLIPGVHPELGRGFTVLVGGGLGRSYAKPDTFARLAEPLAFVTADDVREVIAAIITIYRDAGNRRDRKRARLKYVVDDLGVRAFGAEVERRLGRRLAAPLALPANFDADDHLGWRRAPDGTWRVGVRVGAGRVKDVDGGARLRSALRHLAQTLDVTFAITTQQDIVVAGVRDVDRRAVEAVLDAHGVRSASQLSGVERRALACPALPTCGQALTEAERRLPELVAGLERALAEHGVGARSLQVRMTGCPNGCARPAVAEIGVVGRTKSTYDLYLGGGARGDRLATLYREKVPLEEIPTLLGPIFARWGSDGEPSESFGDFVTRAGTS